MRPYIDLIRTPGAAPLLLGGTIGRIPYGMEVVAMILLLRAAGFSYAEVGFVTGIGGVTMVMTTPVIGRLVDRVGQTPVLPVVAAGAYLVVLSGRSSLAARQAA